MPSQFSQKSFSIHFVFLHAAFNTVFFLASLWLGKTF